ncbi:MAG TPA: formate dehydrogenase accessory protein FdhE [Dehalococcoidia bacterium]|nr:formate dehydrogenase accessory protein FdhE [Dehalococcoidia bacterium]
MGVNERILEKIEGWQQEEGSLPEVVEFYRDLLRAQVEAVAYIPTPQPDATKAEIVAQIRQGVPVLKWNALPFDWSIFQNLFQKVAAIINEHTDSPSDNLKAAAGDIAFLKEVTKAWYENSSLSPLAEQQSIDEELLESAIHYALKPFLAAHAEALIGLVPQEQWRLRYCPICGGKPDFACLDTEKGARWLLCSRCDTEWLFQRLECPYCGNKDGEKLHYFSDDEGLYRLYVCQRCKSYLKAIDLRQTESEILPPLERVMTADMDRQGQEKGYRMGWVGTASDDKR